MQALQTAATGMLAQERRTDVIANNLANMNTTGYQRRRLEFNALIYKASPRPASRESSAGDLVPGVVHSGMGVKAAATYRITDQGFLKATEKPLDMAIQGGGYFQIQLPNGETAYTRDGNFQLDPEGQIVNQDGFVLQPGINIPANTQQITVNAKGEVLAKTAGQETPVAVGTIQIALFANAGGLRALGDNLYGADPQSGAPTIVNPGGGGSGALLQGFVETSNVNPIDEISKLIKAHRAYDMNSKVLQTADAMMAPIGAK
ncbi:MAG: flagellar basal-body rod protein FlgG [Rhodospirillales bacterium]|nr:flagellar basal-body rod protein FlgG [Rhodospirillales bacterium]